MSTKTTVLGAGASHAAQNAHAALVIGGFLVAIVIIWRLARALSRESAPAPPPVSPQRSSWGPVTAVAGIGGVIWYLAKARHSPAVAARPVPVPKPPPPVIIHAAPVHPLLSGWQIVIALVVVAVVILGWRSLAAD